MWILWINTVVSVLGILLGVFIASGSTISIANMQVRWAVGLLLMAWGIPVIFGVSGVGAWVMYALAMHQLVLYWVALPWVYLALFVIAMLITFRLLA